MRARRLAKSVYRSAYRLVPLKRQVATLLRPLPLPWRIKRKLHFDGEIAVQVDARHSFRMLMSGPIETDLFWRGYGHGWEAISLRAWSALVPSASVILDIGANNGVYALAAGALAPTARIIAFEPLGRVHDQLVRNVALNRFNVEVENCAVSDENGWATIYEPRGHHQMASLEPSPDWASPVETKVPTVRIDAFGNEHGIDSVDLIKLDVEGHEPAALRGMGDLLAKSLPSLLLEVNTDEAARADWALLEPLGYEAYRIDERRGLIGAENLHGREGLNRNYLVCRPGVAGQAALRDLVLA